MDPLTPNNVTSTQAQLLCLLERFGRRSVQRHWQRVPRSVVTEIESVAPPLETKGQKSVFGVPASTYDDQTPAVSIYTGLDSGPGLGWLCQQFGNPRLDWQACQGELHRNNIQVCTGHGVPAALQHIPDPPLALYCQGNQDLFKAPAVAVVGARRCSHTGLNVAAQLAEQLAATGLVVVSGLALGIDAAAHRGALKSGHTCAVLGGGLRRVSPARHQSLAHGIINSDGLVVSEYSPTSPSFPSHFPERNRIISGLVQAVVVVEAGLRSGSLITARLALEQGREVMAVPGPVVSPVSAGCHRLLQQGATLVTAARDVLLALGHGDPVGHRDPNAATVAPTAQMGERAPSASQPTLRPKTLKPKTLEGRVFARLDAEPTGLDELVRRCGMQSQVVSQVLTRLELAGFVQRVAGGYIPTPH